MKLCTDCCDLTSGGNLFHSVGAAKAKPRLPIAFLGRREVSEVRIIEQMIVFVTLDSEDTNFKFVFLFCQDKHTDTVQRQGTGGWHLSTKPGPTTPHV